MCERMYDIKEFVSFCRRCWCCCWNSFCVVIVRVKWRIPRAIIIWLTDKSHALFVVAWKIGLFKRLVIKISCPTEDNNKTIKICYSIGFWIVFCTLSKIFELKFWPLKICATIGLCLCNNLWFVILFIYVYAKFTTDHRFLCGLWVIWIISRIKCFPYWIWWNSHARLKTISETNNNAKQPKKM